MLKPNRLLTTLSLAALVGSAACAANGRLGVGVVYVSREPPVERVEVVTTRPGPAHVWIAGHWAWRDPEYVWIAGRWEEPRAGFHEWVRGHWDRDRRGWFWVEGHWR
jgi:hypothetical protein